MIFEHAGVSLPGRSASKTRVNALITRQSIDFRKNFSRRRWMRGSSPRMTLRWKARAVLSGTRKGR
jgi:hypothetical protein